MYKAVSKVGFRYFFYGLLMTVGGSLIAPFILRKYFWDFYVQYPEYITLGMTVLILYVIGFPMMLLLTRKLPKATGEKTQLGFLKYLKYVAITAGLAFIGLIIGLVASWIFPKIGGKVSGSADATGLVSIMFGTNPVLRVLVVGILAPVFEELIFRKLLVDRLAPYGETLAIVASGLMFGMFHGNFQQVFFATLIGGFFAYVYLRTRRVIYTIFLHMTVNITTSAITVSLMQWMFGYMGEDAMQAALEGDAAQLKSLLTELPSEKQILISIASLALVGWIFLLLGIAVTGIVFIIYSLIKKQFVIMPVEGEKSKPRQVGVIFISWGMLLFFATCVVSFLNTYLSIFDKLISWLEDIL